MKQLNTFPSKDSDDQLANDIVHNQWIYQSAPFKERLEGRMLEKKGKQKLMKELYIIYKKEGYKILMK